MDVKGTLTRCAGKGKLTLEKYSPEIALAGSIIFGGLSLAFAIKSTLKAHEVIEHHNERLDEIHEAVEVADEGEYTEIEVRRDTFASYAKTGWEFAKLYAPTVIFGALSVTCSLMGHRILSRRNAALAVTLAAVQKEWNEYRERVRRDYGTEAERRLMYDTAEKVIEHKETDENGKEKKVKEKIQVATRGSVYDRIFDEAHKWYTKDGASSYLKIRAQLLDFNRHIVDESYGFLNFGYRKLGFPITIVGQQAGWVYDPKNPEGSLCQLDGFGTVRVSSNGNVYLDDSTESPEVRAFRQGYERSCLLSFRNLHDNIYDDIKRVDSRIAEV